MCKQREFHFKNRRSSSSSDKENSQSKKPDFKILTNTEDEILFGACIHVYEMDINYNGIYRMFLTANVLTPTEQGQFLSLVSVLEILYNVKVNNK
ncbi:hypothetical protein RhiirA4_449705 [Rhizophagus irregularis]|uniref:Uncharacterized protein n=1 Tax=Rhizophagus irregularis TaxID=588596 RepID=A0A2I1HP38_9GLOM|nr:hypothetical protein RhiirA4_449705 [Rhizophagus irregularis]